MTKMEEIAAVVASHFDIPLDGLKAKRRDRPYIQARHLAAYFIYTNMTYSLKEVGEFFGGRDHTTVIAARRVVENSMFTKDYLYDDYCKLLPEIGKLMSERHQIVVELPVEYDAHQFCRFILKEYKDVKIEIA
jgi:hypothetical protein